MRHACVLNTCHYLIVNWVMCPLDSDHLIEGHSTLLYLLTLSLLSTEITSVFSEDKFPAFYGWISQMKQTDAVKKTILSDEAHVAFIKGYQETGKHDYSHADVTGEGVTIYTKKE